MGGLIISGTNESRDGHPYVTKIGILVVYVCGRWSERPPRQTISGGSVYLPTAQPPADSLYNISSKGDPFLRLSSPLPKMTIQGCYLLYSGDLARSRPL